MPLVNYETGEIVNFDAAAAERRAERITLRLDAIADNYRAVLPMIREAIEKRDDVALGYASPGAYVSDRFGQALAGLGLDVRRAVVGELTAAGMSTRAIAPVVGVSKSQVATDIQVSSTGHLPQSPVSTIPQGEPVCRAVDTGSAPQPEAAPDADPVEAQPRRAGAVDTPPAPVPPKVTGLDGKTYTRPTPSTPSQPKRKPLTDAFWQTLYDTQMKVESLHRLTQDDRWARNADEVAARNRHDLIRINDLLEQVINSLPETEATS